MRFFLSNSEHESLTQRASNWDAVVQSALSVTEGMQAEDVTAEVISELLTSENSESTSSEANATSRINELETNATTTIALLDAIHPTVKAASSIEDKVSAINAILATRPGVQADATTGCSENNDTQNDDVDWSAIDALPHNKEVDCGL